MSLFGSSSNIAGSSSGTQTDYSLPSPPPDSVSSLSFNAQNTALVAGSWDNGVRCWEIQRSSISTAPTAVPRAQMNHQGPVLTTDFHSDSSTVFSGGVDCVVKKWSLGGPGQPTEDIGKHDSAVKSVFWIPALSLVASGSWDKTVKFWDTRAQQPAHTIQLSERVYDMDVRDNWMVVGTADRKIRVYNLANQCRLESTADSTLTHQTRCVRILTDGTGYAVGSIEGRVAIEYFSELPNADGAPRIPPPNPKRGFAFKCHREALPNKGQMGVYPINSISFHRYGTFATSGSDGSVNFWDKDSRQRLKTFPRQSSPISTATFSPDGTMFAYAVCYDWSQGVEHARSMTQTQIKIHSVTDEEIKPREKTRK